jgi:hypothetical protein
MKFKDPVRALNAMLLHDLEMVSKKIYPLPGGTGRRWANEADPRLGNLQGLQGDQVCYYEHIASLRAPKARMYFVAFRETMDALLVRSKDLEKFPEWLMKTPTKQKERMVYIYMVTKHPNEVAVMRSHEDWLTEIGKPDLFDALAYFLYKNQVFSWDEYSGAR